MTTQETIALAATIRDEAKRLENQHLGQSGFTTHTMRCQTLYLKLCEQAPGEALPDARVIAAALKVSEALGETDVTKIRVPGVLALALLNLERVLKHAKCLDIEAGKRILEATRVGHAPGMYVEVTLERAVGPDDSRTYAATPPKEIDQALRILDKLCDEPALAPEALPGLRELVYDAKRTATEKSFADTLAKKCDELAAENERLKQLLSPEAGGEAWR